MTINSPIPGNRSDLRTVSSSITPNPSGWTGTGDAIQLSKLGAVLNVFETRAAVSGSRLNHLASAVHDKAYQLDASTLSQKLLRDMLSRP